MAPDARWWRALNDPVLDRLEDAALAGSPDIAVANARIAQSRAALAANRTALTPTLNASAVAPYVNVPSGLFGGNGQSGDGQGGGRDTATIYNLGFDASWEIDLFGGTRRKIEAASARAEAAEAGLADARVALSAEVARAYVALRGKHAAAGLLERQAGLDRDLLAIAEQRLRAGTQPAQPLEQARATLAGTEATLASTRADAVVLMDQIAVLTGQEPGALDADLATPPSGVTGVPLPPAQVAVADPATLLRHRPDIRTAERRLAAASADVGAQIANRFPKVSVLGLIGLGGQDVGDVFDPAKIIGLALPRLQWNLFDAGRTEAQIRSARGALSEAEAGYRKSVLAALQDAEGSLTRFGATRLAYAKAAQAGEAAANVAELQEQRARGGTIGRADSLSAARAALEAEQQTLSARVNLATAFVAVEKALGLGWEGPDGQK